MDLAATFRIPSKDRSQGQSPPKILAKSFITKTIAHKVKETNNWNIKLLIMRISAVSISEFAFADRIEYAWILSQFVTIFASVS